jgi:hypothetical protein
MPIETPVYNVSELNKGDVVYYFNVNNNGFYIEKGIVKGDSLYTDGVDVYGDGWKQYVSKFFICKVERDGQIIFTSLGDE